MFVRYHLGPHKYPTTKGNNMATQQTPRKAATAPKPAAPKSARQRAPKPAPEPDTAGDIDRPDKSGNGRHDGKNWRPS